MATAGFARAAQMLAQPASTALLSGRAQWRHMATAGSARAAQMLAQSASARGGDRDGYHSDGADNNSDDNNSDDNSDTADTDVEGAPRVFDGMDQVFGMTDFNTANLRTARPKMLDPRSFDETREQNPHLMSLGEAHFALLDPADYLLPEDNDYNQVVRSEYVIGDVVADAHLHGDPASEGKFFPLRSLNEGVSKQLQAELDGTEERLLMVRKPALRIIAKLQAFAAGDWRRGPDAAMLLSGKRGNGKSATLTHVVDFARGNGWLALFVPRMQAILNDSPFMEPSRRRKGFFDQPAFAKQILREFEAGNGGAKGKLAGVAIKTAASPEAEGRLSGFSNLAELVAQHSNEDPQVDHVGLVLDLLRELAAATEHPVLVALDDYNQCYQHTGYFYDGLSVGPDQLTLVNALRFFKPVQVQAVAQEAKTQADDSSSNAKATPAYAFVPSHPLRNGIVLLAESHHRPLSAEMQETHRPVWKAITRASPGRVAHERYVP